MVSRPPVFIVGPPRAGTTLLRVMLCRHPQCWILTETQLYHLWVARYPGLAHGDRTAFDACWPAFTATDEFAHLDVDGDQIAARVRAGRCRAADVMTALLDDARHRHGASVVGEKTPDHAQHVDQLLADFPHARILWMVRDPAATVASELALDRPWTSDDPVIAARRWALAAAGLPVWRDDPRVLTIRFEDLVAAPAATLARVCGHVGLAYRDDLLADEGGHDRYRHGRHDPWGPLDPAAARTGRTLTVRQLERVDAVTAPIAQALGYPPPAARLQGRHRLALAAWRVEGHARQAAALMRAGVR